MAINFPDSPGIGSVFTDTTSGFSYEWTGTLWKSYVPGSVTNIEILDDISGSFDGIETTFNLTVSTVAVIPVNAQQIEIILGGIQQSPGVDYTISGSTVIFTTAPTNGLTFSGKLLGTALTLNTIASGIDGSGLVSLNASELDSGTVPVGRLSGVSTNLVSAIGIQSGGTVIGSGITQLNFVGLNSVSQSADGTVNIDYILGDTGATLSAGSGDQRVVLTSLITGQMTTAATDAELTYNSDTDTLTVGNVSIGGTLTYEDVTNVDSIGLVTARAGIRIGTVSVGGTVGPVGSGIVTYYGDGSQLTGITSISNGTSNINTVQNSTISATVGGENIFNVTGAGVSMVAGERFDVSSYSENVAQLGSVSGTTNLGIGTHSVFIADISGTTSVSFQYEPNSMINGRLFSGTLILRFSGTGTRNVSLTSLNPKYIGGSGPTYSTTAVTDIISFFTPDNGATTYVTVVGQGFA